MYQYKMLLKYIDQVIRGDQSDAVVDCASAKTLKLSESSYVKARTMTILVRPCLRFCVMIRHIQRLVNATYIGSKAITWLALSNNYFYPNSARPLSMSKKRSTTGLKSAKAVKN